MGQISIFDIVERPPERETHYDKHWQDMPEFIQEKSEAYKTIIIRCSCADDVDSLAKAIGQPINHESQTSLWYPELVKAQPKFKRYVDET